MVNSNTKKTKGTKIKGIFDKKSDKKSKNKVGIFDKKSKNKVGIFEEISNIE